MNTTSTKSLTPLVLTLAILCTSCGKKTEQEQAEVVRPAKLVVVQGAVDQRLSRYPANRIPDGRHGDQPSDRCGGSTGRSRR